MIIHPCSMIIITKAPREDNSGIADSATKVIRNLFIFFILSQTAFPGPLNRSMPLAIFRLKSVHLRLFYVRKKTMPHYINRNCCSRRGVAAWFASGVSRPVAATPSSNQEY